jgi:hypothetical protein
MLTRSPWAKVTIVAGALVVGGLVLIGVSAAGGAPRDIGISLSGGGVTGFIFILAQSILARQDASEQLLLQLSLNQDLTGITIRGRRLEQLIVIGKRLVLADMSSCSLRG